MNKKPGDAEPDAQPCPSADYLRSYPIDPSPFLGPTPTLVVHEIKKGEIEKFAGQGGMDDVPTDRLRQKWVKDNTDIGIRPGRQSSRNLIREEARRRLKVGEYPKTKTLEAFAKQLSDWLKRHHPDQPTMSPDRVENAIRDIWQKHFGG